MDLISYIIATQFNENTPQLIRMMLNCGFVISTRPDNDLNPMTALIGISIGL
jgi:hypothetical protein